MAVVAADVAVVITDLVVHVEGGVLVPAISESMVAVGLVVGLVVDSAVTLAAGTGVVEEVCCLV